MKLECGQCDFEIEYLQPEDVLANRIGFPFLEMLEHRGITGHDRFKVTFF